MPRYYHATTLENAWGIVGEERFYCGEAGFAGPGVYLCKRASAAVRRMRSRGEPGAKVVFWIDTYTNAERVDGNGREPSFLLRDPDSEIRSWGIHWDRSGELYEFRGTVFPGPTQRLCWA